MLTFDGEKHEYVWDGIVVPSVTQIIGEWLELPDLNIYVNKNTGKTIPSDVMKNAADFGTAIHKAIKLLIENNLDWRSLDENLLPALNQFKNWWLMEAPLFKKFIVFDFKTGATGNVAAQLSGYAQLIKENEHLISLIGSKNIRYICEIPLYSEKYGYAGTPDLILNYKKGILPKRYVLKIPKNGDRCKAVEITSTKDWIYFNAKLTAYNYERNK